MSSVVKPQESGEKKSWWAGKRAWLVGVVVGVLLSIVMVLASGFMIDTTNKDTFCVTCHVMTPFRTSDAHRGHIGDGRSERS